MKTFDKEARCPYCGIAHQAASKIEQDNEGGPKDGSISMCIACGHFGVFEEAAPGGIRRTTAKEAAEFACDPQLMRVSLAWQMGEQKRRAGGFPHA